MMRILCVLLCAVALIACQNTQVPSPAGAGSMAKGAAEGAGSMAKGAAEGAGSMAKGAAEGAGSMMKGAGSMAEGSGSGSGAGAGVDEAAAKALADELAKAKSDYASETGALPDAEDLGAAIKAHIAKWDKWVANIGPRVDAAKGTPAVEPWVAKVAALKDALAKAKAASDAGNLGDANAAITSVWQ